MASTSGDTADHHGLAGPSGPSSSPPVPPPSFFVQRLQDLLHTGGVVTTTTTTTNVSNNNNNHDVVVDQENILMDQLETWLGMSTSAVCTTTTTSTPTSSVIKTTHHHNDDIQKNMRMLMEDNNNIIMTMEDVAPLSSSIYPILQEVLIETWNPGAAITNNNTNTSTSSEYLSGSTTNGGSTATATSSSSSSMLLFDHYHHSNLLLDYERQHPTISPLEMSLYTSMKVIRVTRWIRYWMELNVLGSSSNNSCGRDGGTEPTMMTLSHFLLQLPKQQQQQQRQQQESHPQLKQEQQQKQQQQQQQQQTPSTSSPPLSFRLIQALYHHIEELPQLQGQIYLYTKTLTRNMGNGISSNVSAASTNTSTSTSTTTGLTPHVVSQRLQQYQLQQAVITKLTSEWEDHIYRLEYILCEWYRIATPSLRQICRIQLGKIWNQFVLRTMVGSGSGSGSGSSGSTSSNVRVENTTSSGIDMTLRVLLRIIRGMKPITTTPTTPTPTMMTNLISKNNNNNNNMEEDEKNNDNDHVKKKDKSTTTTATSSSSSSSSLLLCYEHLLFHQLVPLHTPNSLVLWRDQTSVLELYHEPLVQCIATIFQKQQQQQQEDQQRIDDEGDNDGTTNHKSLHPRRRRIIRDEWIGKVLLALQDSSIWGSNKTSSGGGNTPKLVLLLHEMDTYLSLLSSETIQGTSTSSSSSSTNTISSDSNNRPTSTDHDGKDDAGDADGEDLTVTVLFPLLHTLGRCASSDHSRLAERALSFFQNKSLVTWVLREDVFEPALRRILPYLVAGSGPSATPSWNPTVRKMTHAVLTTFQKAHPEQFEQVCEDLFPTETEDNVYHKDDAGADLQPPRRPGTAQLGGSMNPETNNTISTTDFTLKAGMAGWKPPSGGRGGGSSGGGALASSSSSMPPPHNRGSSAATSAGGVSSSTQPPLSVTGVAPWAMNNNGSNNKVIKGVHHSIGGGVAPWANKPQQHPSMINNGSNKNTPQTIGRGKAPWAQSSSGAGTRGGGKGAGAAPPLTVTGVAPWAMTNQAMNPPSRLNNKGNNNVNPPLTVTGVAPWAMGNNSLPKQPPRLPQQQSPSGLLASIMPRTTSRRRPPSPGGPLSGGAAGSGMVAVTEQTEEEDETTAMDEEHSQEDDTHSDNISFSKPKNRVLRYMEEIAPPKEQMGASSWSKAQMAETPTLLPKLKFHDLVFGHELGKGAFGSVKYARLIDKTKTRSYWSEYATKIISTTKIQELGYEASVQREMAVLRVLSHPSIARLVSSFRFREGVYLVLEYASGGDLHSLLSKNGSLDHASTRFVMGEVVAALASIHDMGFVYSDLKPENIVITETGHIKLTDFGACRPVTAAAKELITSSAKNLLRELRDGDWKTKNSKKSSSSQSIVHKRKQPVLDGWDEDKDESEHSEDGMSHTTNESEETGDPSEDDNHDLRVEGTTAYLPPEVVMGAVPTRAADSWALGCVLYQCLSGRPPIVEEDEATTKHRIVSFDVRESPTNTGGEEEDPLFRESHASGIESDAKNLIKKLLNRNMANRPTMSQVSQHDFFVQAGTDVFGLHRQPAHPLDVGGVSPVADAQWSRRQFSSIWAPQPQAYNINLGSDDGKKNRQGGLAASMDPIIEGEEAGAFFGRSGSSMAVAMSVMGGGSSRTGSGSSRMFPTGLRHISEKMPLPPTS